MLFDWKYKRMNNDNENKCKNLGYVCFFVYDMLPIHSICNNFQMRLKTPTKKIYIWEINVTPKILS